MVIYKLVVHLNKKIIVRRGTKLEEKYVVIYTVFYESFTFFFFGFSLQPYIIPW